MKVSRTRRRLLLTDDGSFLLKRVNGVVGVCWPRSE